MAKVTATVAAWNDLVGSIEWASDHADVTAIIRKVRAHTHDEVSHKEVTLTVDDAEFALLEEPIVDGGLQGEFQIG